MNKKVYINKNDNCSNKILKKLKEIEKFKLVNSHWLKADKNKIVYIPEDCKETWNSESYTKFILCPHMYNVLYLVFTTKGFFEVVTESWPEWDLNPWPLNSVQTL